MKMKKRMMQSRTSSLWRLLIILLCIWLFPVRSYADTNEPEQIIYEGLIFAEYENAAYPEEILEKNGKRYQRVSVETRSVEKDGSLTYVSTVVPCQLEGEQMPPEQATVTLTFDITGEEYQREISLQEIREKSIFWKDDFSFPITVQGYGADVFYLGEHEIAAETDLAEYSSYFLEYLELPQDCYRIEHIEWSGERYEREGIFYRDAVAYGEKLIRDVETVYGGQVRTPNIPAKQYVAVYEEIIEAGGNTESVSSESEIFSVIPESETISETMPDRQEEEDSFIDRMFQRIKEHITVVVFGSLFLVCFGIWIVFVWYTGRKQKGKAGD